MQERLKDYNEVLLHGVGFFRPPNSSSRTAVEDEASLGIDKKKIPIEPELRSLALELSGYLVSLCEKACFIEEALALAACIAFACSQVQLTQNSPMLSLVPQKELHAAVAISTLVIGADVQCRDWMRSRAMCCCGAGRAITREIVWCRSSLQHSWRASWTSTAWSAHMLESPRSCSSSSVRVRLTPFHQYSAAVGLRYAECSLAPWLCNVEHKQRWG
jgi:hypothetical protein